MAAGVLKKESFFEPDYGRVSVALQRAGVQLLAGDRGQLAGAMRPEGLPSSGTEAGGGPNPVQPREEELRSVEASGLQPGEHPQQEEAGLEVCPSPEQQPQAQKELQVGSHESTGAASQAVGQGGGLVEAMQEMAPKASALLALTWSTCKTLGPHL